MIAAVMLGLAEIELEYRRERQMAGIAVAQKKGKFTGRKKRERPSGSQTGPRNSKIKV
jgi:DNA invertase Pin-like site-specific DNA recombinase